MSGGLIKNNIGQLRVLCSETNWCNLECEMFKVACKVCKVDQRHLNDLDDTVSYVDVVHELKRSRCDYI